MKLRLDMIPKGWNGEPLGIFKKDEEDEGAPRDLQSYLKEALFSAHVAGYIEVTGQPKPESSKNLLERSRLHGKLERGRSVLITTEELEVIQDCVAAHFLDIASVPLIGAIHASIEPEKGEDAGDADGDDEYVERKSTGKKKKGKKKD
jgi:hypothetical protein